jgi:hypothetical protein
VKKSARIRVAAVVVILTPCLFLLAWNANYGPGDPKNIRYALWKRGLVSMNLDLALETMVDDPGRPSVVGKSEDDLRKEFGYLRPIAEANSYLRSCYLNSPWNGRRAMSLRDSNWMVVFEGGKATDLVLAKGC